MCFPLASNFVIPSVGHVSAVLSGLPEQSRARAPMLLATGLEYVRGKVNRDDGQVDQRRPKKIWNHLLLSSVFTYNDKDSQNNAGQRDSQPRLHVEMCQEEAHLLLSLKWLFKSYSPRQTKMEHRKRHLKKKENTWRGSEMWIAHGPERKERRLWESGTAVSTCPWEMRSKFPRGCQTPRGAGFQRETCTTILDLGAHTYFIFC